MGKFSRRRENNNWKIVAVGWYFDETTARNVARSKESYRRRASVFVIISAIRRIKQTEIVAAEVVLLVA